MNRPPSTSVHTSLYRLQHSMPPQIRFEKSAKVLWALGVLRLSLNMHIALLGRRHRRSLATNQTTIAERVLCCRELRIQR
jgi:hypothetical protein